MLNQNSSVDYEELVRIKAIARTYWVEIALVCWWSAALILMHASGLRTNTFTIAKSYASLVFSFYPWLAAAVIILYAVRTARKERTWRQCGVTLAILTAGLACLSLIIAQYSQIKSVIPHFNGLLTDNYLGAIERFVFFGHFPPLALRASDMSPTWIARWDYIYTHSFHAMFLGAFFVIAVEKPVRLWRYLRCIAIIYAIAIIYSISLPSAGPCFMDPDVFRAPKTTISYNAQGYLSSALQFVLAKPYEFLPKPYLGISAFPSVHVATASLPAFFFLQRHRWALLFIVPFALAIAAGTVILGWHYAIDTPGGIALAGLAYLLTGITERNDETTTTEL